MKTKDLGNKEIMSENIKRHLNNKRLNIKEFAEIMNFKYTTVLDWVNAKTYPRIDKIELMARYFGVDKSDLVEEYSETPSTLYEINKVSEKLDEPRQKIVLETANIQLKEQKEEEKKNTNVIPIKKKRLTDEELWDVVEHGVASDGSEQTEYEKQFFFNLLREKLDNDDSYED
ncbi:helix-turn-helix domain-containing protein [Lactococcus petauri]|uniref:helix-turn-helix domain-containing protein n=1 Tax=Lactococcus petauri TaxID=1940789 RepID=UPI0025516808|nr:helix-turn-helix transcriptional regulator [Lactococcus petauri]